MRLIDLTNKTFGRWTVLRKAETVKGQIKWLCRCECGTEKLITGFTLRNNTSTSCGCYLKEQASKRMTKRLTKHGMCNTRIYRIWRDIKRRCTSSLPCDVKHYSSKGITLCDEWFNTPELFINWALSNGYEEHLTIDRIGNNKGYLPDNCRWVTMKVQNFNRSNTVMVGNEKLIDICTKYNLEHKYKTVYRRVFDKGWSIEQAINVPFKDTKNG